MRLGFYGGVSTVTGSKFPVESSRELVTLRSPHVVISASGMATGRPEYKDVVELN